MNNTLMFVDDEKNILNSLTRIFRKEGYNILLAESGESAIELLRNNQVAVVVSDNKMPGMNGTELMHKVKERSPDTIRFMLTGCLDVMTVMEAVNKGEVHRYITKPWDDEELKLTIKAAVERYNLIEENKRLSEVTKRQNAMLEEMNHGLEAKVEEKTRKIWENFFAFVGLCADLIELHDPFSGGHSKRVAEASRALAAAMGLNDAESGVVWAAALLHNIGLVGVPKEALEKAEGELQEGEKALLRNNPVLSQELLSKIDTLRQVGVIIRSHMESFDGSGYPDRLHGEEIHLGARIIAVCKAYDTLRHGKRALSRRDALVMIERERGRRFDPAVVDAFVAIAPDLKEDAAPGPGHKGPVCLEIKISEVQPGMVLAKDLKTDRGRLLVTKGTVLSSALIEKVLNFNRIDPITGHVLVLSAEA